MAKSDKTCPICDAATTADFAPFCSKRCRDVDLNRWLGGVYSIAADTSAEEDFDPLNDNAPPKNQ